MKILLAITLFVAVVNAAENIYGFARDKSADLASDENALAGQYGFSGTYGRKRRSTVDENAFAGQYGFSGTYGRKRRSTADENTWSSQYGVAGTYGRKRRSTADENALRGQYGMYKDGRERRSIIDDYVPVIHSDEDEEEEIADEYHNRSWDGHHGDLDRDFDGQDEADYNAGYDRKRRSDKTETDESTNQQRPQDFDDYLYGNYRQGRRYWN